MIAPASSTTTERAALKFCAGGRSQSLYPFDPDPMPYAIPGDWEHWRNESLLDMPVTATSTSDDDAHGGNSAIMALALRERQDLQTQ